MIHPLGILTHPLSYLTGSGAQTAAVLPLMWYSLIVSIVVTLIISALVVGAAVKGRAPDRAGHRADDVRAIAVDRRTGGVRWIWIGVGISMVPLLVSLVWTVAVLADVGPLPAKPPLTIDIGAHQWWWDAEYSGATPDQRFHTANEIHIPVGQRVLLRLASVDVIHSFWVPRLAGKMDVIPGQTNLTWVEARTPGRYRGQCAEFCGYQHAHMAFDVVAEPPAAFEAWRQGQLRPAPAALTPAQMRGLGIVEYRCSLCHAVRGTAAGSNAGPDLTHLMSRATIAAGTLPNNPSALSGWIENPQASKPGALMPNQALGGQQLTDLRAYLETLR